jgi:hypothetical protein
VCAVENCLHNAVLCDSVMNVVAYCGLIE